MFKYGNLDQEAVSEGMMEYRIYTEHEMVSEGGVRE
jgi:hypothetical protein